MERGCGHPAGHRSQAQEMAYKAGAVVPPLLPLLLVQCVSKYVPDTQ